MYLVTAVAFSWSAIESIACNNMKQHQNFEVIAIQFISMLLTKKKSDINSLIVIKNKYCIYKIEKYIYISNKKI